MSDQTTKKKSLFGISWPQLFGPEPATKNIITLIENDPGGWTIKETQISVLIADNGRLIIEFRHRGGLFLFGCEAENNLLIARGTPDARTDAVFPGRADKRRLFAAMAGWRAKHGKQS